MVCGRRSGPEQESLLKKRRRRKGRSRSLIACSPPGASGGRFPLGRVLQRRFSGLRISQSQGAPLVSVPGAGEGLPAARRQTCSTSWAGRGLRVPGGATEPTRAPNRRPEYADPRRGPPPGSARESRGEEQCPGCPEAREGLCPGEPLLSWSEPKRSLLGGAGAFPQIRCSHRCCFNGLGGEILTDSWNWEKEAWFLKNLRVGL